MPANNLRYQVRHLITLAANRRCRGYNPDEECPRLAVQGRLYCSPCQRKINRENATVDETLHSLTAQTMKRLEKKKDKIKKRAVELPRMLNQAAMLASEVNALQTSTAQSFDTPQIAEQLERINIALDSAPTGQPQSQPQTQPQTQPPLFSPFSFGVPPAPPPPPTRQSGGLNFAAFGAPNDSVRQRPSPFQPTSQPAVVVNAADECAVCREPLESRHNMRLHCAGAGHVIHTGCMMAACLNFTGGVAACPTCRTNLTEAEICKLFNSILSLQHIQALPSDRQSTLRAAYQAPSFTNDAVQTHFPVRDTMQV